jgi:hypothetical protein
MLNKSVVTHSLLTFFWLLAAGISLYAGLEYYTLPLHDRAYSDLHDWYKPSGLVGHGLGILGSLMMVIGVAMYSVRKRMRRFEHSGKLGTWLTAHIFLCTLGPYFVMLHTAFRFGGIISIAFWSMVAVVLSGIFGRYVYARIPKSANGQFLSESALNARQKHLLHSIMEYHDIDEAGIASILDSLEPAGRKEEKPSRMMAWVPQRASNSRKRKRLLNEARDRGLTGSDASLFAQRVLDYGNLIRQASFSDVFQRLFGYWHVFHLPLALILMTIMLFHIGIAFTFGYFWIS